VQVGASRAYIWMEQSAFGEGWMKEGAWINVSNRDYRWIDEHAQWLQRPGNAASLGLEDDIIEALGRVPWDFNGSGRRTILLTAMDHGLIRVRGHGASVTFEFTVPWAQAVRGALRFMDENLGPSMQCRFSNLLTGQSVEFGFGRVRDRLEQEDLSFLLPPWQRAQTHPPVPRPFLVADLSGKGTEWLCWPLPGEMHARGLVALVRRHVPEGGGWLALADGRTWKVTPSTPPLLAVDGQEALRPFDICPDCGWPHAEPHAPCQCKSGAPCPLCRMPSFWPTPMHDHVQLDGSMTYVPHVAGYAHTCVPWSRVKVLGLQNLLGR